MKKSFIKPRLTSNSVYLGLHLLILSPSPKNWDYRHAPPDKVLILNTEYMLIYLKEHTFAKRSRTVKILKI